MIVARIAGGIQSHLVTRLPEWALSLESLAIAWQFLRGDNTIGSDASYMYLSHFGNDKGYGLGALVIGTVWCIALIINGSVSGFARWSPLVRSFIAIASAAYWGFVAYGLYVSNSVGISVVLSAGLAAMSVAISISVAREVGEAQGRASRCFLSLERGEVIDGTVE